MFSSYIADGAITRIEEVLRSGYLSDGKVVEEFEREFEKVFNLPVGSFVTTNSGTSALHLALETLGVKGEVLLPANTFVATGMAVLMAGCTPVFCDIYTNGTINSMEVRKRIGPKTGAVIGVNWAGQTCISSLLEAICKEAGIPLIIDGAQSLGVSVGGDAYCYSFQATKHLTTGDGGGIHFPDFVHANRARRLRWFGISKDTSVGMLGEREYELKRVGYKYHMNDYAATLGLANLEGITERFEYYKEIAEYYAKHLKFFVACDWEFENAYWAMPIEVGDVVRFTKFCRERGVPCSIIHRGIDHNPVFGGPYDLPVQREWERTVTHLPIHMDITLEDAAWICNEVNQYE